MGAGCFGRAGQSGDLQSDPVSFLRNELRRPAAEGQIRQRWEQLSALCDGSDRCLLPALCPGAAKSPKREKPQTALEWDRRTTSPGHAYQEIFNRRLTRGQSFASLSLGWREFTPSYFGPFREGTKVCSEIPDIVIPSMLREVFPAGYRSDWRAVYDTNLVIHKAC